MDNRNYVMTELENAERRTRFCGCGDYMVPGADQNGIWLRCRTFDKPKSGRLTRVASVLMPHDRILIIGQDELAPYESTAPSLVAASRAAATVRAEGRAA